MLLEREQELAALSHALSEAQRGRGQVVLVEASAGIGKTSLLRAAVETAVDAGFACSASDERASSSATSPTAASASSSSRSSPRVRAPSATACSRAPLRSRSRSSQPAVAGPLAPSTDTTYSMLHGLYWLLSNLADEAPVVLSVDDLQWADAESLRFLELPGPPPGRPAAGRSCAPPRTGEPADADLARLAAAPETTVLRPRPLSIDGHGGAVRVSGSGADVAPEFAAACWEATGGNPFFLEALLREAGGQQGRCPTPARRRACGASGPPPSPRRCCCACPSAPAAASALVRAVAVLGDGASLAEAAGLAGLAEDEAARAADLLAALEILTPGERWSSPTRSCARPSTRTSGRTSGPRRTPGRPASSPRAAPRRNGSPRRSPRRSRSGTRRGSSSCAAWPTRRSGAGRPLPPSPGSRRALAEPPPPGSTGDRAARARIARSCALAAPEAAGHLAAAVERASGNPSCSPRRSACSATRSRWAAAVGPRGRGHGVGGPSRRAGRPRAGAAARGGARRRTPRRRASRPAAPAARRLERHAGLAGATPGERLVLASLAFERAAEQRVRERGRRHHRACARRGPAAGANRSSTSRRRSTCSSSASGHGGARPRRRGAWSGCSPMHETAVSIPAVAFVLAHRGWRRPPPRRTAAGGGRRPHGARAADRARHPARRRTRAGRPHRGARRRGRGRRRRPGARHERLRRGDPTGPAEQRPARGTGPAAPRAGQGRRGRRRSGRVRPPRRAVGRRQPAGVALALARLAGADGHG